MSSESDITQVTNTAPDENDIPIIRDTNLLQRYGVIKAPVSSQFNPSKWAAEFSTVTPLNLTSEGDNEYAFYRNILDEPDFPFDDILDSPIGDVISTYFAGVKDIKKDIRLDDAFCIHYNTTQADTTCAKHMDPSDITVNLCLEKTDDVKGSEVMFYGTQNLMGSETEGHDGDDEKKELDDDSKPYQFLVEQEAGVATIHLGCHPHQTLPLKSGKRTNIVLTYCYTDESKSGVALRTCYL